MAEKSPITYIENLQAGWRDEYGQLVHFIGKMTDKEFNADSEPHEVVCAIKNQITKVSGIDSVAAFT
jgi:hypothetical protein